jgi:hypothetical protein
MTSARRQLEQELAEVAAGRRATVSSGTQLQVSSEEYHLREKRRSHESDLERAASQQLKAMQEGQESASWAAERAHEVSQAALLETSAHHMALEQAAARRLDLERDAHAAAAHDREAHLAFERDAHDAAMYAAENSEHAAHDRFHRTEEAQRIRSSPTYLAVLKLQEQWELQRLIDEEMEIEQLLSPAITALSALRCALQAEDYEVATCLALARQTAGAADAQARFDHQFALSSAKTALKALHVKIDANAAELEKCKATLNPLSWFGQRAARRGRLEALALDLRIQRYAAENDMRRIPPPAPAMTETTELPRSRAMQVKEQCRVANVRALVKTLDGEIKAWLHQKERSNEIKEWLDPMGFDRSDAAIDYTWCVALDRARSAGAVDIAYPGLGLVPDNASLPDTLIRIELLRQQRPAFAFDEGGTAPKGLNDLRMLRAAVNSGELPG